jgi:hypothetical protein
MGGPEVLLKSTIMSFFYKQIYFTSRNHERTILLRFLGIILRVLRLDVEVRKRLWEFIEICKKLREFEGTRNLKAKL